MKINYLTVLPASVRYDKQLSDKAILLWGEISASADQYGISADDNAYFAKVMQIDQRSVARLMVQLIDNGHAVRFIDKNKRKIKVVLKQIDLPIEQAEILADPKPIDEFCNKFISMWEQSLDTQITDKESLSPLMRRCLALFTEEEILEAARNKIKFFKEIDMIPNVSGILTSDEILKWLKAK